MIDPPSCGTRSLTRFEAILSNVLVIHLVVLLPFLQFYKNKTLIFLCFFLIFTANPWHVAFVILIPSLPLPASQLVRFCLERFDVKWGTLIVLGYSKVTLLSANVQSL